MHASESKDICVAYSRANNIEKSGKEEEEEEEEDDVLVRACCARVRRSLIRQFRCDSSDAREAMRKVFEAIETEFKRFGREMREDVQSEERKRWQKALLIQEEKPFIKNYWNFNTIEEKPVTDDDIIDVKSFIEKNQNRRSSNIILKFKSATMQTVPTNQHQFNGIAERAIRTIKGGASAKRRRRGDEETNGEKETRTMSSEKFKTSMDEFCGEKSTMESAIANARAFSSPSLSSSSSSPRERSMISIN
jgi:hypothetical protein